MHMPLALLHGYFGPISIKDHGVSEVTNEQCCHVWVSTLLNVLYYYSFPWPKKCIKYLGICLEIWVTP